MSHERSCYIRPQTYNVSRNIVCIYIQCFAKHCMSDSKTIKSVLIESQIKSSPMLSFAAAADEWKRNQTPERCILSRPKCLRCGKPEQTCVDLSLLMTPCGNVVLIHAECMAEMCDSCKQPISVCFATGATLVSCSLRCPHCNGFKPANWTPGSKKCNDCL